MACTRQMLAEGPEASREPSVPQERPSGQKKEGLCRCPVSFPNTSSGRVGESVFVECPSRRRKVRCEVDQPLPGSTATVSVSVSATATAAALGPRAERAFPAPRIVLW